MTNTEFEAMSVEELQESLAYWEAMLQEAQDIKATRMLVDAQFEEVRKAYEDAADADIALYQSIALDGSQAVVNAAHAATANIKAYRDAYHRRDETDKRLNALHAVSNDRYIEKCQAEVDGFRLRIAELGSPKHAKIALVIKELNALSADLAIPEVDTKLASAYLRGLADMLEGADQ